jgi:uncharacterized protein YmfQ (DUF2313 family)
MTDQEQYKADRQAWIDTEQERQADMQLHVEQLQKETEYFEYQVKCNNQRLKHASTCLDKARTALEEYIKG